MLPSSALFTVDYLPLFVGSAPQKYTCAELRMPLLVPISILEPPRPFNTLLLNIKSSKYAQIQEVTCSLFKSELDAS
jgi:hypothetical protein